MFCVIESCNYEMYPMFMDCCPGKCLEKVLAATTTLKLHCQTVLLDFCWAKNSITINIYVNSSTTVLLAQTEFFL